MFTKFKFPTMPATGQKVCGVVVWCGGCGGWWLKPILVFSLAQAEQNQSGILATYI